MRTRISSICCLVCALFLSLLFAQRYHLSPWFRCHTICIQICAIYVHISSTHKPQLKRHWTGNIVLTGAIYIYVDSFKTNTTVRIQLSNESHNFVSMLQWNIPADGLLPLMPTWDAGGGGGANKVAGLSSFTVTQIFYMASPLFDTASFREMMHQVSPPVKEIKDKLPSWNNTMGLLWFAARDCASKLRYLAVRGKYLLLFTTWKQSVLF